MSDSPSAATPVSLAQCGKTFPDGTRALEPIDLEVDAGETIVLLGPSGCGKTTLLRIIAGLEQPDHGGQVRFGTDDVTALPIERRNVGMVFQSYALFPNMNVAENIGYGLKVRGLASDERTRQVGALLEMMHLGELAQRRIDQLSGGQKQRVALARALAVRPRVLLLDEPLTALDAKLREELRTEIDRLLRSLAITALYVTHDQAEAMALGDRIAVMERGKIAQIGTPQDIYYRPASPFVAEFIGTMNRLTLGGRSVQVRPEAIRIVDAANADLQGTIVSAFFLGNHTRLVIKPASGGEAAPIIVETAAQRTFRVGETIHLKVDGTTSQGQPC